MQPLVSVVIPTFNVERYIERAIQSVLKQSWQECEIIIVDDCSTDDTVQVIKQFIDCNIKLYTNPKNYGPSHSRNKAISMAKGDWIALLDADDWFAPERLEILVKLAQEYDADIVADNVLKVHAITQENDLIFFKGLNLQQPHILDPSDYVQAKILGEEELSIGLFKPLLKKQFLLEHDLKFDEAVRFSEDFQLFALCLAHGARFVVLPKAYYYYLYREGSLSSIDLIGIYVNRYNIFTSFLKHHYIKSHPNLLAYCVEYLEQNEIHRVWHLLIRGSFIPAITNMIFNSYFSWRALSGLGSIALERFLLRLQRYNG